MSRPGGTPHPGCRIGRIRPRGGKSAELVVLQPVNDRRRIMIMRELRAILDGFDTEVGGFAIVVWDKGHSSSCASLTDEMLPSILVPDFVRERLMSHRILRWAQEDVREMLGAPPPDASA